ncbi:LSM domain-containing protein [Tubulinosema ratisbonensis]|uniref:LSM domain-containing protein n=1 Tax=Tubulinosema ratisbonensis TaxID=291195 RepID=A0A437AJK7_9MICR|nr:LSM domain-containing protein [Tubulinosema ratisbonensis]RVD93288.1 LSM domain-containing protein [Tubulinosema ratisbonensis]
MDTTEEILGTKDNEQFLDKPVIVVMKDGKCLQGIFRSFDQFNNITLEDVNEREYQEGMFKERNIDLFVIRGESIFFFGIGKYDDSKYKMIE